MFRKACESFVFIIALGGALPAFAGPEVESIADILQNTEFPSGFLSTRDCGNDFLAVVIRQHTEQQFRKLSLKEQIFVVHRITHQIWGFIMREPEFGAGYAQTADASILALRLRIISEAKSLGAFREELLAISWDSSALFNFTNKLQPEAIADFIKFQTKVATLPPRDGGTLSAARANLELNVYANLTLLYGAQLLGKRPLVAIANLHRIVDLALRQGERHSQSHLDLITRPSTMIVMTAMLAFPRVSGAADRVTFVNLTESIFKVVESLARGILEEDTELAHHQKGVFLEHLKQLRANPQLRHFPAIEKSIARYIQLFEAPPAGQRAN